MKELSTARPKIMLVIGLPGAGKSFFASRFAKTFGAAMVSFDRLRAIIFEKPSFCAQETAMLNRVVNYQITELLRSKNSFIVDGGFSSKVERLNLARLARDFGYDILVIWVQAPDGLALTRSMNRRSDQENDLYNTNISQQQFESIAKHQTAPLRENFVAISGLQTYPVQAKAVLKKLSAPRIAAAATAHRTERITALQRTARPLSSRKSVTIN